MLAYGTTFKPFRVTGANQDLSIITHVTKDLRKWQISSNCNPNISEVQHSFSNQFVPRFRPILILIQSQIKFLASVIFRRQQPFNSRDQKPFLAQSEGSNPRGGGGGTPPKYLYGYVPPNGVVILGLLI